MNIRSLPALLGFIFLLSFAGVGQPPGKSSRTAEPNLETLGLAGEVPRERREQAYARLLEGQRHIWTAGRLRSQAGIANSNRLAKLAFEKAVELNPKLAEGYTALAELAINAQPGDIEEAIALASTAVKVQPNNFGSRRILARLYTYKSKINSDSLDADFSGKAVAQWRLVTALDPRNAEAWAFLSEFYERQGKTDDQIDALKKWISSATPVDSVFYRRFMGGDSSLTPDAASLKLGAALTRSGRVREAIEVLSVVIVDDPANFAALDLLREAIQTARDGAAAAAIEPLRQAVQANPANISLVGLLARTQAKSGKLNEAVSLINAAVAKTIGSDTPTASALKVLLGDIMNGENRSGDAISAYEESLSVRGLGKALILSEDEREFAVQVFSKIIDTLKAADRGSEVITMIERARKLLGKDDLFADRQLISFYRESGRRSEALSAAQAARARVPNDYGLLRLEATLLAESGRVDEGVALVKSLLDAKPSTSSRSDGGSTTVSVAVPNYDDFSNFLFISNLYTQAGRGKEAAEAANQAYNVARGAERKQIARLTLATAQQTSREYAAAENTLREILKESPGNPIALNNLGYFLLERGERFEEALDLIRKAVAVDPTNPSYLDSLGWAYFLLGKTDEAEKHLREAARLDSGSSTIQEHLGDVYQKQGKRELARGAWQKALNLASEGAEIERLKKKLRPEN